MLKVARSRTRVRNEHAIVARAKAERIDANHDLKEEVRAQHLMGALGEAYCSIFPKVA